MWSQIVTTSKLEDNKYRSKRYLPYVFTEQGIAMLSGVLKNQIAIKVGINIMNDHVGASLKDLGKKCFGINKIEDNEYIKRIYEHL